MKIKHRVGTLIFYIALVCIALVVGSVSFVSAQSAQQKWAKFGTETIVTDGDPKYPDAEVVNGRAFVSWSTDGGAMLGERSMVGGTFRETKVGEINGDATFLTTSIASGGDGVLHYVWTYDGSSVSHKSRAINGAWSAEHTVADNQNYANALSIGAQGSNLFVVWRDKEGALLLATSTDGGVSWNTKPMGAKGYGKSTPRFAVRGTDVYLAWLGGDFYNYLGKWNGTTFPAQRIFSHTKLREPQIAALPSGLLAMANRDDNNPYYGEQLADGSWNVNQFSTTGGASPTVAIAVDKAGNVHMAWMGYYQGARQVYYTVKKRDADAFLEPIVVTSTKDRYKVNLSMAVDSSGSFVHLFWERFYIANVGDSWPKHEIRSVLVQVAFAVTPPAPPCKQFDAGKRCIEVDSAIGILSTLPPGFIQSVFALILSFSGGIGVLLIMYAGYVLITSRDKKEQAQKAREIILAVIVGLLMMIFSFTLLETIGVDILSLPGFGR